MDGLKIVCISDTHGKHSNDELDLPDADCIIHAGDFTSTGTAYQAELFLSWFDKLPYKKKILCAGNHDWLCQRDPIAFIKLLHNCNSQIIYLNHSSCNIEGVNIFGSPWTPAFYNWAFNYNREIGEKLWKAIPDNTNILITHGPPYGIHDYVEGAAKQSSWNNDDHVGCKALLERINQLKDLRLHVFGHIHCGRGYLENGKTTFINASVLSEDYQPYAVKGFIHNY